MALVGPVQCHGLSWARVGIDTLTTEYAALACVLCVIAVASCATELTRPHSLGEGWGIAAVCIYLRNASNFDQEASFRLPANCHVCLARALDAASYACLSSTENGSVRYNNRDMQLLRGARVSHLILRAPLVNDLIGIDALPLLRVLKLETRSSPEDVRVDPEFEGSVQVTRMAD